MSEPHRVVVTAFPGIEILDAAGPAEVFSVATRLLGGERPGYRVEIAAAGPGPVTTSSGVRLHADLTLDQVGGGIDTLLVAGAVDTADGPPVALVDHAVTAWLRAAAGRATRIGGICAGAHLLAAAGLLAGRPATTHWLTAAQLAAQHPEIEVDADPIFVRSGHIWTCAGITAGMDLALAMVAEDHGQALALATARTMVMYVKRPGGQSQFSVPLSAPPPPDDRFGPLLRLIAEQPSADLSTEALAARSGLSVRHFSRLFARHTGRPPAAYVEGARLERARRLLEESDRALADVARASGLGSVETLHRAFRRGLNTTPADYRRRFR
ncbi:GlxA family transcriptional regulator [Kitasatospora sp. DSM 101779]|uniref:GlxA family transcriptional regulator n=1 Tax=Kitasatospora sp. DSM 101779 TaxID=2853165 RepID=UPI0021D9472E|nr:helix-turn-helix domain-containing protein [Kitasatospora sp. DSM 101779]MCU7826556.1 helix-turn-helix domain-containing protein [Kitasatospora sp. DSM 101779]